MTVSFTLFGTAQSSQSSSGPSFPSPAPNTATDWHYCFVASGQASQNTPTMPAGWTQVGTLSGGSGATYGIDVGNRRVTVFKKDVTTALDASGTQQFVSLVSGNTMRAAIVRVSVPAGHIVREHFSAVADATHDTSWSVTSAALPIKAGQLLFVLTAQSTDSATQSAQAISAAGITFGAITNRDSTAVTFGNDHRFVLDSIPVTAGNATVAATWSHTNSANASGTTAFLLLEAVLQVSPTGIASGEVFGSPSVGNATLGQQIEPAGIASAEAFGAPGVVLMRQIVAPAGIASAEAFGAPAMMPHLSPAGIASGEAFGTPVMVQTAAGLSLLAAWRPVVTLNAVDVSAQLVGELSIDIEEGAARIAEFSLVLASGAVVTLPAYVGQPVEIFVAAQASDGSAVAPVRVFVGVVDVPSFTPGRRVVGFRCTDDLQGILAAQSIAALDTLIGGHWSPHVFDETADRWQYAQDRLATVAAALDRSATSGNLRLTSWAAKTLPDFAFDAAEIAEGTLAVSLANREQIKNRIEIEFDYRYPRCKRRSVTATLDLPAFGWNFLVAGHMFLQRDAVRQALSAVGWTAVGGDDGITFDAVPASGLYSNPSNPAEQLSWTVGDWGPLLCLGFTATLTRAYVQSIREAYSIVVENAASVAAMGTLVDRRQAAFEVEFDARAWETAANDQAAGVTITGEQVVPIEPVIAVPAAGAEAAANVQPAGFDRAAADAAIRTLVAEAQTAIAAAHRQNSIDFALPIMPTLDVTHTVELTVPGLAARGKVRALRHRMDITSGEAMTEATLAIASLAGLGYTHPADAVTPPAAPTPPTPGVGASFACTCTFDHLLAGTHELEVVTPAVDDESRGDVEIPVAQTYAAGFAEDLFTVTA